MKKTKTCIRCVDRNSNVWFMDSHMGCAWGIAILNNVRNDFRGRLLRRGFVILIDILSYLELPVSREALTLGWVWDDKEKFPDLDLFLTTNGDEYIPFDHKLKIKFVDLVDLSKILDPDTAIE